MIQLVHWVKHSIRMSLSPGCHTQDPLDVQLDDDHYIGCILESV